MMGYQLKFNPIISKIKKSCLDKNLIIKYIISLFIMVNTLKIFILTKITEFHMRLEKIWVGVLF